MITFQAFLLYALGMSCVLSSLPTLNTTDKESPFTIPIEVLNQLTDITEDSNGLLPLWKSANYLAKDRILISEYQQLERKTCRGLVFNEVSTETRKCENITSLTHIELASYYNELVIQFKVSESFLLNHIEREIQEEYRTIAEEKIRQNIRLLDEEILPLLALVLNTTTNNVNCSDTEEIVNNMMSLYNDCAAVQTANIYLAQTTLDLYGILTNILNFSNTSDVDGTEDGDGMEGELDFTIYSDEQWCILQ